MPKFNRQQKFNKTNINKVPKDKAIVYEITNANGTNLYTGVAGRGRVQQRLTEHLDKKGEKIPGGTQFKIAQVKDKPRALQVEKQIIKKENPKFNKQHNNK
ncbi:GIY-YIG nuclease family protein [Candidatus Pacebacteria bacterium]|nr:GIY-YIG nuclease family protein [Candidatus Paceibacterota bacterium]